MGGSATDGAALSGRSCGSFKVCGLCRSIRGMRSIPHPLPDESHDSISHHPTFRSPRPVPCVAGRHRVGRAFADGLPGGRGGPDAAERLLPAGRHPILPCRPRVQTLEGGSGPEGLQEGAGRRRLVQRQVRRRLPRLRPLIAGREPGVAERSGGRLEMVDGVVFTRGVPGFPPGASWVLRCHTVLGSARPHGFGCPRCERSVATEDDLE